VDVESDIDVDVDTDLEVDEEEDEDVDKDDWGLIVVVVDAVVSDEHDAEGEVLFDAETIKKKLFLDTNILFIVKS